MKLITSLTDYFRSSKSEFEKVSWPSRQQTIRYSALVMGVSVVIALFFAGLDFGLGKLVDALLTGRQNTTAAQPSTQAPTVTPTTEPVNAPPGLDVKATDQTFTPPATTPTPAPKP